MADPEYAVRCSACGADVPEGARFCTQCGVAAPPPRPRSAARLLQNALLAAIAILSLVLVLQGR